MRYLYGSGIPEKLGIHKIAPNDVTLDLSIFRKGEFDNERENE